MMKLYECHNGFMGYAPVRVLVVASSKKKAKALASEAFKKDAEEINGRLTKPMYPSRYWENVEANMLCSDLSCPWTGEVNDG